MYSIYSKCLGSSKIAFDSTKTVTQNRTQELQHGTESIASVYNRTVASALDKEEVVETSSLV